MGKKAKFIPNTLVVGESGSGKSMAEARTALEFPGSVIIGDPHKDSLAQVVLEHAESDNILFDDLSFVYPSIGYSLLKASTHSDESVRQRQNLRRIELFVSGMERGASSSGQAPLREEWTYAALGAFLYQDPPKPPELVPDALEPQSDGYKALIRDCTNPHYRDKLSTLQAYNPRALRSEVGSAVRRLERVFRDPAFMVRCRDGLNYDKFLAQKKAYLIIQGGDASPEVKRAIIGGINLNVVEYVERRKAPFPPVLIILDEAGNSQIAGEFEQLKAGETRKYGLHWDFLVQFMNLVGGSEAVLANCQRKAICRSGYEVARQFAPMIAAGLPASEETRASQIERLVRDITRMQPGWRWVIDREGSHKEYVPMLESPYPDWPGLRYAYLEKKLCRICSRAEYRQKTEESLLTNTSATVTPSNDTSSHSSGVQDLLRRLLGRKPGDGSETK